MHAPDNDPSSLEEDIKILGRTVNALNAVLDRNPKITLGSLCTYLYVATHQENFAYAGQPVREIAQKLQISNLPKHMKVLEFGIEGAPASRLIGFHINEYDQRIRLPRLTESGIILQCEIVATLTEQRVEPPRSPNAAALDALASPDDVDQLTDDDFGEIVWD